MNNTTASKTFLQDLGRVAQARQHIAEHLNEMAQSIQQAEQEGEQGSGQLGLERDIEDVSRASQNLKQGVFRLLVLGDMKRGKSTFLNALIGENLLPSDVNPCTALLTILKYGAEKRVTVHFNNDRSPEQLDFQSFKECYTIIPEEAKEWAKSNQQAFPDVSHAVVEYPLALLEKGVEIVDSPGLNDTEARNELSLGYINNCHAVLFVLRASQPCTMAERRYLENYMKERSLSIFFLINAWDQVKESLIDPDDSQELEAAESKLRKVFLTHLAPYCQVEGADLYHERVFEISALKALRKRVKDTDAPLEGTGFPAFMSALSTFLTEERAVSELRQARTIARQARQRVVDAVDRRLPLLDQNVAELKQLISSVEPEFGQLVKIRDQFQEEIHQTRDRKSRQIADSFRDYVFSLEQTFENDFLKYQPPSLKILDIFNQDKRSALDAALKQAFQQYINDKFFAWTLQAEKDLGAAFGGLSKEAIKYGTSYQSILDQISEKLTGRPIEPRHSRAVTEEESSPAWAKWAVGLYSLASGNITGVAMLAGGFDFKSVALNIMTVGSIAIVSGALFGIMLGPISLALLGFGVGVLQAEQARNELVKVTKRELVKHLPQVAQEQWQPIYSAVQECFNSYELEVIPRMNDDIQSRQKELDNLVQQKESREIHRETELQRLNDFKQTVATACRGVENVYESLLAG
jgi:GTPase SAR1 family protein/gas vesicle protein